MVLYAAAQTGPVAFVTTGLTMSAQEQLFAATIEHSMEALVENAASHGRTEEESLRFAHGALRTIEIGLAGAGALGLFKFAKKNAPVLMSKCASMKASLKQRVHEVFTHAQTNRANFEQQNSQRLYDTVIRESHLFSKKPRSTTGVGKDRPLFQRGENPSARPTWQQSEKDDTMRYRRAGQKVETQVSFKNGQRCAHGTPGSIRVDNFVGNQVAVEMKNYNLNTNVDNLINNIVEQALKHQQHLPQGVRQIFKIDARGQVCTPQMEGSIKEKIILRTNGLLAERDIIIIKE